MWSTFFCLIGVVIVSTCTSIAAAPVHVSPSASSQSVQVRELPIQNGNWHNRRSTQNSAARSTDLEYILRRAVADPILVRTALKKRGLQTRIVHTKQLTPIKPSSLEKRAGNTNKALPPPPPLVHKSRSDALKPGPAPGDKNTAPKPKLTLKTTFKEDGKAIAQPKPKLRLITSFDKDGKVLQNTLPKTNSKNARPLANQNRLQPPHPNSKSSLQRQPSVNPDPEARTRAKSRYNSQRLEASKSRAPAPSDGKPEAKLQTIRNYRGNQKLVVDIPKQAQVKSVASPNSNVKSPKPGDDTPVIGEWDLKGRKNAEERLRAAVAIHKQLENKVVGPKLGDDTPVIDEWDLSKKKSAEQELRQKFAAAQRKDKNEVIGPKLIGPWEPEEFPGLSSPVSPPHNQPGQALTKNTNRAEPAKAPKTIENTSGSNPWHVRNEGPLRNDARPALLGDALVESESRQDGATQAKDSATNKGKMKQAPEPALLRDLNDDKRKLLDTHTNKRHGQIFE